MGNDGAETRERIMAATKDALIEKGFSGLTMSDIAARSNTSTSLLHYHFDTKEELLIAFLDFQVEAINTDIAAIADDNPIDRIHELLSWYVVHADQEQERQAFHVALLELRVNAPRNEQFRSRIRQADRAIRAGLESAIEDGINADLIRHIDPAETAALLLAAADGANTRRLFTGEAIYERTVEEALTDQLLADVFSADALARWRSLLEGL